ncbi:MAG: TonB family protein [Terriglobales bacterium]
MKSPDQRLLRLLVEKDPASPEFRSKVRAALRGPEAAAPEFSGNDQFDLWHDVFVERPLPWNRFLQSALLHAAAVVLIVTLSLSWLRQQKILNPTAFDRSSLVTYTPQEYLPPLDTGASKTPKAQKGDPVYAKQPILSVPREADNRSQTIVAPPDLKLNHDVPLPNIIATGAIAPSVPLDATQSVRSRIVAPETQVVAPAPEVNFAPDRVVRAAMKSDVIAPPPELTPSTKGHVGLMNIGPSDVVAPAPQLTVAEQHTVTARGKGHLPGGVQPVGPPPSVSGTGSASPSGRLIALGIHPVAPTGPVTVPGGNRRGTFAAGPQGKSGAAGTPDLAGSKTDAKGSGSRGDGNGFSGRNHGSLPSGLHVGAGDSNADGAREVASLSSSGSAPGARVASAVPEDKITDVDRKVFGGKRVYGRTLNMPNLNSSTGSWVMKFAELDGGRKDDGELMEPVAMEKSDPGYPLELMRSNVHGMVTLYAIIRPDGKVGDIRVLYSPDERLDAYAAKALARWKFVPAERAGKPVALEAVVEIPFRVRQSF